MPQIRKVIIPVAGLGTRFLPATKAQPKEMLPILDKPTIQYIVEDAVKAGIQDIILVTGKTKRAIEDHFDRDTILEEALIKSGKRALAKDIKAISGLANFIYIRQKGPYGNGTPVLDAQPLIGDQPFAVLWGDDIWRCPKKTQLEQLIDTFEKYGDPVLTGKIITKAETKKYGVIKGVRVEKDVYQVSAIIEKPGPAKAPSLIGSFGGFIFTPDIFAELKKTTPGKGREVWLVDAIARLLKKRPFYAKIIDGTYYDIGSKLSWLKTNVDFALQDPEVSQEFRTYLKKTINKK
jgi:UTP--glucose-1-phosphate uridylyltransferase